jgi:hypothetical protein
MKRTCSRVGLRVSGPALQCSSTLKWTVCHVLTSAPPQNRQPENEHPPVRPLLLLPAPSLHADDYARQCLKSSSPRPSSSVEPLPSPRSGPYVSIHENAPGRSIADALGRSQSGDADTAPLDDLEYLLLVAGNSDEDNPYRKISAIQVSLPPCMTSSGS